MSSIRKTAHALGNRVLRRRKTPRIFFCHVPKCAGTSIARTIRQTLYPFSPAKQFTINLTASHRGAVALGTPMHELRQNFMAYNLALPSTRFGWGHIPCKPGVVNEFSHDWAFTTMLRDPVDRWISAFVYSSFKNNGWFENELDIDQYVATDRAILDGRILIRYFSNAREADIARLTPKQISVHSNEAVENLSNFALVGTSSDPAAWVARFNSSFGYRLILDKSNESPNAGLMNELKSDKATMSRVRNLCAPDLDIYERLLRSGVVACQNV